MRHLWKSVRVADGARLESVCTFIRTEGSNPSFSANPQKSPLVFSSGLFCGLVIKEGNVLKRSSRAKRDQRPQGANPDSDISVGTEYLQGAISEKAR